MDALRPFLTQLFGSAVAALAAWLYSKYGVSLNPDAQAKLIAGGVFVVLTLGGFAKTLLSRKVNPANAAKPSIVPTTSERAPGPTLRASAVVPEGETTGLEGQRRG